MSARKRRAKPAIRILIAALLLVLIVIIVFFALGFRYTTTDKGIKFIGKYQDGHPFTGLINYPSGVDARLDYNAKTITFENGDLYEGEIKGFLRNGKGTMKYNTTGDTYTGDFLDDEITGTGTFTYRNGDVYTGAVLGGKMHGYGVITFNSGAKYEGNFDNGVRSGNGTYIWASGAKYEGNFANDIKNGYGKMKYANGDYYEGQFVDDKKQGEGIYTWADGEKYKGSFINNLIDTRVLDGNGQFLKNDDGTYKHGTKGEYTFINADGVPSRTYIGNFEEGKVVGVDFEIKETN